MTVGNRSRCKWRCSTLLDDDNNSRELKPINSLPLLKGREFFFVYSHSTWYRVTESTLERGKLPVNPTCGGGPWPGRTGAAYEDGLCGPNVTGAVRQSGGGGSCGSEAGRRLVGQGGVIGPVTG